MMNFSDIMIGQRVRYKGSCAIGPCVGVVLKLYPPDEECPGAVRMKPDTLPEKWPYTDSVVFAPWVDDLESVA